MEISLKHIKIICLVDGNILIVLQMGKCSGTPYINQDWRVLVCFGGTAVQNPKPTKNMSGIKQYRILFK